MIGLPETYRDKHPSHCIRSDHTAHHGIGEVAGKRFRVKDEPHAQQDEQKRSNHGTGFGKPNARKQIFPRQAKARDAKRQPCYRRWKASYSFS